MSPMISFYLDKNIYARVSFSENVMDGDVTILKQDNLELTPEGWHNDEISISPSPLTELHGGSQKNT
ncbi:hypothetical protein MTR_4g060760 [Medicago truncatula]|uniref:Uncharacterized protein n=1 Tax=Medicago truncatula TaxID=3880 RepID=G7JQI1_MEDTR|nr:hypothetical protein MTR_4g060760 [Medicago truncatula]